MQNTNLIKDFLSRRVFAVVGVSRDREKYGYKVFMDLRNAGYKVYPINPNAESINGIKCYKNLSSLPEKPEVVEFVVPPNVTLEVLKECKRLGIRNVWFQPGSESKDVLDFCKRNGMNAVHGVCIIIERKGRE
ncbi:MAG TPA: CoA-binding protein [Candidatus Aenigmarchaeota archaeon]|nr:MAG: CoA-binding protein [Candidatus Aenigmarchaeota archaeon]HDD46347.1 CoA-binding protein [Candidatus Aenigmarchaeota archaeon]